MKMLRQRNRFPEIGQELLVRVVPVLRQPLRLALFLRPFLGFDLFLVNLGQAVEA